MRFILIAILGFIIGFSSGYFYPPEEYNFLKKEIIHQDPEIQKEVKKELHELVKSTLA